MAKFGFFALILGIAGIISVTTLSGTASAVDGCKRVKFETELVKNACTQGGQKAAKDAMKKFLKANKAKKPGLDCGTCHSKLAPAYPLKPDGLQAYKALGGT